MVRTHAGEAERQIGELRRLASSSHGFAPQVSGWSVGMHIQHCALAMSGILSSLLGCEGPPPERSPNLVGRGVLMTGRIPRGAAQAPAVALPKRDVGQAELIEELARCERLLSSAPEMAENAWFRHFGLGVLRRDQALRFLAVHNDHHLRIIRDILAA